MAGTLKLAAVVAALAAVGWAVIGGTGPRDAAFQAGSSSPSPTAPADWAFFSGTMTFDGTDRAPRQSSRDASGIWVDVEFGGTGHHMVTDDPRMTGTRTDVTTLFSDAADDSTGNIGSSLITIENDDGSWTCPMTFIHMVTDRNEAGEIEQWAGWCEGSGGYEGLKAYLAMRQPEDLASSGRQGIYGFITSGDGPPMPEAPAG